MSHGVPVTIALLRDRHLSLMREWRTIGDPVAMAERAEQLRRDVMAAGTDIMGAGERDEAQGIIDYWGSAIAALPGQSYPELITVAEYEGHSAIQAGDSAQQVCESLDTEVEKRIARRIFEQLLTLGPSGVERSAPRDRSVLRQNAGAADPSVFDAVLTRFEETGAIARLPGDIPESDRFEVTDPIITERWPELRSWLEDASSYDRELRQTLTVAERWDSKQRDPLMVMRGDALESAKRFKGESELLDEYIEAGNAARSRARGMLALILCTGLIVLSGLAAFYFFRAETLTGEKAELAGQIAEYEKRLAALKEDEAVAERPDAIAQQGEGEATEPAARGDGSILTGLDEFDGAVWLGTPEQPQVRLENGDLPKGFADARPGTRFRVRSDIFLRTQMPASGGDYVSPQQKAVIPGGTLIELRGPARSYRRNSGDQYWADVRVIPQVYVQYVNGDRGSLAGLRTELAGFGFDVPPEERIDSAKGKSEIRFFNAEDASSAARLQAELNETVGLTAIECRTMTKSRLSGERFRLELWIDFSLDSKLIALSRC